MSIIVILGMHRSGTSCLTHMLHQAGMYLGDDVMTEGKSDNLGGHWEASEAMTINELALMLSGGTWNVVPDIIRSNETIDARMATFVGQLATHRLAGWKDPRTTLTFPLWKPHLAAYRIVVCLRHPLAVARSLAVRQHGTVAEGLMLWMAYYRRLLEYLPAEPVVDWFDYDAPRAALQEQVAALCRSFGLETNNRVLATFNEQLRHQSTVHERLPDEVQQMYDYLRRQAQENMRRLGVRDDEECKAASDDSLIGLRDRLDEVVSARRFENVVIQELDARIRALETIVRESASTEIAKSVAALEARVDEQERIIEQLRATLKHRPSGVSPHF